MTAPGEGKRTNHTNFRFLWASVAYLDAPAPARYNAAVGPTARVAGPGLPGSATSVTSM
jgi:hypothetical protein